MSENWIYFFVIVLFVFDDRCFARDIFVNINLDYLPPVRDLKVYNGPSAEITNCKNLRNEGQSVLLSISKDMTNQICNNTLNTLTFFIFTYHTDITQALVTIENKNYSPDSIRNLLLKISENIVIINIASEYVNFIVCRNQFITCQYQSVDQRDVIRNDTSLTIYSACKQSNDGSSCITEIEFTMTLNDVDSKSYSMGSEIIVKKSNMKQFYGTISSCRNGGTLSNVSTSEIVSCNCQNTADFIERGPQCEALQLALTTKRYLYILPNTVTLRIDFSLYSIGHQGNSEIFRITNDRNITLMKYNVIQAVHWLEVSSSKISISYALDQTNKWLQMIIVVTFDKITFQVNEKVETMNIPMPLNLDTLPLILFSEKERSNDICISNLKINNRLVDLYLPQYSNCRPNCGKCDSNQKCIFVPFKSDANAECICKSGLIKNGQSCIKELKLLNQIASEKETSNLIPKTSFSGAQFKFRTLATNGNIVVLELSNPTGFNVAIGISNKFLFASVSSATNNNTLLTNFYEVTDGKWHSIKLIMDHNFFELTMDEYYTTRSLFPVGFFNPTFANAEAQRITLGKLLGASGPTCFDTFSLLPVSSAERFFTLPENSSLGQGCSDEPNCFSLACNESQKCIPNWQNSSCVCADGFRSENATCLFIKCLNETCKNGGLCSYDSTTKDYKCTCPSTYTGVNCEQIIQTAGFLWWIILLIILILLLIFIVLLIYCCCIKKRKESKNVPDIDKVHENTVCYNDQAGEVDYNGPPINFNIMKSSLKPNNIQPNNIKSKAPPYPTEDLQKRKLYIDANNNDLNIDHPLEYGFEGFNSDAGSVSSLGSGSTDEQLNIQPLDRTDNKFDYLKNLYE